MYVVWLCAGIWSIVKTVLPVVFVLGPPVLPLDAPVEVPVIEELLTLFTAPYKNPPFILSHVPPNKTDGSVLFTLI